MYRQFALHDIAQTRWRNGAGLIRDIVCWPMGAGADEFQWRVSVADVHSSGSFSVFPGIERTILLLDGDGIRLRAAQHGGDHRLDHPYRPLRLPGETPFDCDLLGAASRDFNVMTRRNEVAADVQILTTATNSPPSRGGLIFAARGSWTLRTHYDFTLRPETGICWADESLQWIATPIADRDAVLIAVRILPRVGQH